MIERCLELSRAGMGHVAPNPMVGCVITCNGEIIGEGFHRTYGGDHAEIEALKSVKDPSLLHQSTLYVSLEPCNHHGKTPPCTKAIIESGIPKVVIGMTDPNPRVSGSGIAALREAGIEVEGPVMEAECLWVNRRFVIFHMEKRPYIILKWAQSCDGFMNVTPDIKKNGEPFWISSEPSRWLVHQWRKEEFAVLTGSDTVLNDNPRLTVRAMSGRNPVRIVLDRRGRVKGDFHVLDQDAPTWIMCSEERAEEGTLKYIRLNNDAPLKEVLLTLYNEGVQSVLVEAGANLLRAFIDADLWDEARVFSAPHPLGDGTAAPAIKGIQPRVEQIHTDILNVYHHKHPPERR
ncbi:MAG: bifunctional diaminohydroxyphosphoribosylaminopyrimidine deaminase/5-amino-6-(5-phosphoribosylamino)uracil reductase RibD [Flavobacteriales bacterium]|nr:bifunctional diaminohydroxyphosphoribosylaminopyrimidine deaminase/5-amino-6-(5-phosphoribosylamino)uracil reductase RibD [Flavobacteriales bacterium]